MSDDETVMLSVLLWAHPGAEVRLAAYEDEVLHLVGDHGGQVLYRARARAGSDDGPEQPCEVHLTRFPSPAALDGYMGDDRRTALAARRDEAIARTEVIRVDLVDGQ